jgi:hypothetical protein
MHWYGRKGQNARAKRPWAPAQAFFGRMAHCSPVGLPLQFPLEVSGGGGQLVIDWFSPYK